MITQRLKKWFGQSTIDSTIQSNKLTAINALIDFLVKQVDSKGQHVNVLQQANRFLAWSDKQKAEQLPWIYLLFEKYLAELNPNILFERSILRDMVKNNFPELLSIPYFSFIFQPEEKHDYYLGRIFISKLINRSRERLGVFDKGILDKLGLMNETDAVDGSKTIHILGDIALGGAAQTDWSSFYKRSAEKIHASTADRFDEALADEIFESSYSDLESLYGNLSTFHRLLSLLPESLLGPARVNALSSQQAKNLLTEKLEILERRNRELSTKNLEYSKVQEHLEKQLEKKIRQETKSLKKSAADWKKKARSLEEVNKDLQQFTAIVSHDLKQPTQNILALLPLLEMHLGEKMDEDAQEYIGLLNKVTFRMESLINDLLTYSKIGKDDVEIVEIDLDDLLENLKIVLGDKIKLSNALIHGKNLGTIKGNSTLIFQLLQNLLQNAIKFRADKSPIVSVSCFTRTDEWEVIIKDNGIGIPEMYQQRIFEPFQRLHNRSRYEGSGIGLSTCKKIVERHGGKIWVVSDGKNNGSAFHFTIPF